MTWVTWVVAGGSGRKGSLSFARATERQWQRYALKSWRGFTSVKATTSAVSVLFQTRTQLSDSYSIHPRPIIYDTWYYPDRTFDWGHHSDGMSFIISVLQRSTKGTLGRIPVSQAVLIVYSCGRYSFGGPFQFEPKRVRRHFEPRPSNAAMLRLL